MLMDDDKILEYTTKMESTLGKEQFAMISDTVGEILTGNTLNMQAIKDRDEQIAQLKDKNEKLVTANGALLQKVPVGIQEPQKAPEKEKPVEKKEISWNDIFDKKGNFIH